MARLLSSSRPCARRTRKDCSLLGTFKTTYQHLSKVCLSPISPLFLQTSRLVSCVVVGSAAMMTKYPCLVATHVDVESLFENHKEGDMPWKDIVRDVCPSFLACPSINVLFSSHLIGVGASLFGMRRLRIGSAHVHPTTPRC